MKPVVIDGADPIDAWKKVVNFLAASGGSFNLVVNIRQPLNFSDNDLQLYDPRKKLSTARSVEDVANTIFPKRSIRWAHTCDEFTRHYEKAYRTLLSNGPRSWGIYFLRLVDFGNKHVNQLARVVSGLSSWGRNHKAAFVIHFSSMETDVPKHLGAPCLQYCEFIRDGDSLSLLAVYRSHDYYLKALGNFIGLTRLLHYVAEKANLPVGSIICHSTYAYLDGNRRRALELVAEGER